MTKLAPHMRRRIAAGEIAAWLWEETKKLDAHRTLHVDPLLEAAEAGTETYNRYDEALDLLGEDAIELLEQFSVRYYREVIANIQ